MLPVVVTAMLAGCGQPGALYMPKKPAPPASAAAAPPIIPVISVAPAAAAPAAARSITPAAQ